MTNIRIDHCPAAARLPVPVHGSGAAAVETQRQDRSADSIDPSPLCYCAMMFNLNADRTDNRFRIGFQLHDCPDICLVNPGLPHRYFTVQDSICHLLDFASQKS
ncbi:hypothetical protein J6590_049517 [Homalodisca vitripennis]|nr:hypothetical protein J6590_049517 [Homalodisca vitripennis]